MTKKTKLLLLCLLFLYSFQLLPLSLWAQTTQRASSFKSSDKNTSLPVTKDTQINDPLLEEQLNEELEQKELEKEAIEAQGKDLLREGGGQVPQVNPSEQQNSNSQSNTQNETDSELKVDDLKKTQEIQSDTNSPLFKSNTTKPMEQNDDKVISTPRKIKGWNPRSPEKGFLTASDDDDSYYYKEESSDSDEREYKGESRVTPKKSTYKKGLMKVTSDGSYVYKIDESPLDGSASLRFTNMPPLPLVHEIAGQVITFDDIYGDSPFTLTLIDYDWLAFRQLGHWVISVGTTIGNKTGQGRFIDDASLAFEKYTLWVFLNHISLTYRFQYSPHPWFVPYFSGGFVPAFFYESRDDNKRNKFKFIPAAQASGGIRFNIGRMDDYGAGILDAEYGINNFWIDVEYRRIQSVGSKVDISSNLINVGLGFDL